MQQSRAPGWVCARLCAKGVWQSLSRDTPDRTPAHMGGPAHDPDARHAGAPGMALYLPEACCSLSSLHRATSWAARCPLQEPLLFQTTPQLGEEVRYMQVSMYLSGWPLCWDGIEAMVRAAGVACTSRQTGIAFMCVGISVCSTYYGLRRQCNRQASRPGSAHPWHALSNVCRGVLCALECEQGAKVTPVMVRASRPKWERLWRARSGTWRA